jgi:CO/xanthine dehydrogenase Mo-binding subunit
MHCLSLRVCVAGAEVDAETGGVQVIKLTQAFDVGRAINPSLIAGRIHGGAMMALGLALLEESYPDYPWLERRVGEFGSYLALSQLDLIRCVHRSCVRPYLGGNAASGCAARSAAAARRRTAPTPRTGPVGKPPTG